PTKNGRWRSSPATERRLLPKPAPPRCRGGPKEAETSDGRDRSATAEADDLRRGGGRRRGALDGFTHLRASRAGEVRDRGARPAGRRPAGLPVDRAVPGRAG